MLLMAVNRILATEDRVILKGVANIRMKILTTLATTSYAYVKETILRHITEDMSKRLDLALCWLYEEYALQQGYKSTEAPQEAYNFLLCTFVSAIDAIPGEDGDEILARLYLEAPLITEDAVEALKTISSENSCGLAPLELLKDLVVRRPTKKLLFLNVLLYHTGHENEKIHENAIQVVMQLYGRAKLSRLIDDYAVMYLGFLRLRNPPDIVFGKDRGRPNAEENWSVSTTRVCLGLYLALLSQNQKLIHELGRIYTFMSPAVNRIVLQLIKSSAWPIQHYSRFLVPRR